MLTVEDFLSFQHDIVNSDGKLQDLRSRTLCMRMDVTHTSLGAEARIIWIKSLESRVCKEHQRPPTIAAVVKLHLFWKNKVQTPLQASASWNLLACPGEDVSFESFQTKFPVLSMISWILSENESKSSEAPNDFLWVLSLIVNKVV